MLGGRFDNVSIAAGARGAAGVGTARRQGPAPVSPPVSPVPWRWRPRAGAPGRAAGRAAGPGQGRGGSASPGRRGGPPPTAPGPGAAPGPAESGTHFQVSPIRFRARFRTRVRNGWHGCPGHFPGAARRSGPFRAAGPETRYRLAARRSPGGAARNAGALAAALALALAAARLPPPIGPDGGQPTSTSMPRRAPRGPLTSTRTCVFVRN